MLMDPPCANSSSKEWRRRKRGERKPLQPLKPLPKRKDFKRSSRRIATKKLIGAMAKKAKSRWKKRMMEILISINPSKSY
jgi:hypothetical protein